MRTPRSGFSRKMNDALTSLFRKRAARIDVGPYRIAVMDEINSQVSTLKSEIFSLRDHRSLRLES